MQFYYGQQMPLRVLDEAEFWKMQEKEHTVVIRKIVDNLEQEYVTALEQWELAFATTHQKVGSLIESIIRSSRISPQLHRQVMQLIAYALDESARFISFLRQMKANSSAVRNNPVAQTVIDHIIRESEYFIGIARLVINRKP